MTGAAPGARECGRRVSSEMVVRLNLMGTGLTCRGKGEGGSRAGLSCRRRTHHWQAVLARPAGKLAGDKHVWQCSREQQCSGYDSRAHAPAAALPAPLSAVAHAACRCLQSLLWLAALPPQQHLPLILPPALLTLTRCDVRCCDVVGRQARPPEPAAAPPSAWLPPGESPLSLRDVSASATSATSLGSGPCPGSLWRLAQAAKPAGRLAEEGTREGQWPSHCGF